jgi:hypothetical protein
MGAEDQAAGVRPGGGDPLNLFRTGGLTGREGPSIVVIMQPTVRGRGIEGGADMDKSELEPVISVLAHYDAGTLDPDRDNDLIIDACEVVQSHRYDPKVCRTIHPSELEPGMAVCFVYKRTDVNLPFRFGVVDSWKSGAWTIFTFNLDRDRKKTKSGRTRIVRRGPGFRSYGAKSMIHVRLVDVSGMRLGRVAKNTPENRASRQVHITRRAGTTHDSP